MVCFSQRLFRKMSRLLVLELDPGVFFLTVLFQTGRNLAEFQSQAKMLLRRLDDQSPAMSSLESRDMLFQYENDRTAFF